MTRAKISTTFGSYLCKRDCICFYFITGHVKNSNRPNSKDCVPEKYENPSSQFERVKLKITFGEQILKNRYIIAMQSLIKYRFSPEMGADLLMPI